MKKTVVVKLEKSVQISQFWTNSISVTAALSDWWSRTLPVMLKQKLQ